MVKCKYCKSLEWREDTEGKRYPWCPNAIESPNIEQKIECVIFKRMTNADKIRSMSDVDLANLICNIHTVDIDEYEYEISIRGKRFKKWSDVLEWLKKEEEGVRETLL